jgi:hypothetical protein
MRCQKSATQGKRKRKDRVLPLDHFKRGMQVFQERHGNILKESAIAPVPAQA